MPCPAVRRAVGDRATPSVYLSKTPLSSRDWSQRRCPPPSDSCEPAWPWRLAWLWQTHSVPRSHPSGWLCECQLAYWWMWGGPVDGVPGCQCPVSPWSNWCSGWDLFARSSFPGRGPQTQAGPFSAGHWQTAARWASGRCCQPAIWSTHPGTPLGARLRSVEAETCRVTDDFDSGRGSSKKSDPFLRLPQKSMISMGIQPGHINISSYSISHSFQVCNFRQWEFQDPKLEVLYHISGHFLEGYSLKFRPNK